MGKRIEYFVKNHPHLFEYQTADEVHVHDRFLYWSILRFLPEYITPNRITFLRLCLTPVVFSLMFTGWYYIGIIAFLCTAFTDALDGSLARTKNQITQFGKLFDPLADKLLIGSMILILVFRYLDPRLAIVALAIEIIIILVASLAKLKFKTVKGANRWGKIKMVLQVIAVCCTGLALVFETPYLFTIAAWLFGLSIGFALLSLFTLGL